MKNYSPQHYKLLKQFCTISILEGVSYLLLLGIAMPLKYMFDMPLYVKYLGWAHGVLFVLYGIYVVLCWYKYKWAYEKAALIFLASLIPFAPFYVDRRLKKEAGIA